MSLISPNFDFKSIFFFPILARGFSPKLLEKALNNHLSKIQLMMALEMGFYWLQSVHYFNEKIHEP